VQVAVGVISLGGEKALANFFASASVLKVA
jgi:hypothetical protein